MAQSRRFPAEPGSSYPGAALCRPSGRLLLRPSPAEEKETGRVEAFSDGVFAIAITLLVLDLKVPRPQEAAHGVSLLVVLARQWPTYAGYLTSFLTILIMWLNHHRMFSHIKKVDHTFLLLNGLLLLTVSTVPFPTALVAAFMNHPGMGAASAVYSGCCLLLALAYNGLWRYGSHNGRLLAPHYDEAAVESLTRQYRFGPALYTLAFAVSFVNGSLSLLICMALALFFALPPRQG